MVGKQRHPRDLDDDQLAAMIQKLSVSKHPKAKDQLAALKAEHRSRGGGRGASNPNHNKKRLNAPPARVEREEEYDEEEEEYEEEYEEEEYEVEEEEYEDGEEEYEEEEEEEEEDDDDDEEYDDFNAEAAPQPTRYQEEEEEDEESDSDEYDEDGPMVGYGYSDEMSVVSEMTTPTVVSSAFVPKEEHYHEVKLQQLGSSGRLGGGNAAPSKKKDLLGQVNRANTAAAARQQHNLKRSSPRGGGGGRGGRGGRGGGRGGGGGRQPRQQGGGAKKPTGKPNPRSGGANNTKNSSSGGRGGGARAIKKIAPPARNHQNTSTANSGWETFDSSSNTFAQQVQGMKMDSSGFPFAFGDSSGTANTSTDPFQPFSGDPFSTAVDANQFPAFTDAPAPAPAPSRSNNARRPKKSGANRNKR